MELMKTGFVYKLVSKDIEVKECYVGSTGNTRVRKAHHKSDCNNVNSKLFNYKVYQYIRDNSGFQNWDLIVLETVQYNQKFELRARERHHMEALGATLNSRMPNRNMAEYYVDNAEHIRQQQKQYYQDNAEQINQQKKQYHQDNAEQINQQKKQYYQNNAEQIKQHKNQKHDCECGGRYTHRNTARHEKSVKHQKHLEQK
jgi:hypothetical protein